MRSSPRKSPAKKLRSSPKKLRSSPKKLRSPKKSPNKRKSPHRGGSPPHPPPNVVVLNGIEKLLADPQTVKSNKPMINNMASLMDWQYNLLFTDQPADFVLTGAAKGNDIEETIGINLAGYVACHLMAEYMVYSLSVRGRDMPTALSLIRDSWNTKLTDKDRFIGNLLARATWMQTQPFRQGGARMFKVNNDWKRLYTEIYKSPRKDDKDTIFKDSAQVRSCAWVLTKIPIRELNAELSDSTKKAFKAYVIGLKKV